MNNVDLFVVWTEYGVISAVVRHYLMVMGRYG